MAQINETLCSEIHKKKSKGCTDKVFLVFFLGFLALVALITVFAVTYGDYIAIIKGYDSFGNICGLKDNKPYKNFPLSGTDLSKKPILLFSTFSNQADTVKFCVEECLTLLFRNDDQLYSYFTAKLNKTLCRYDFNVSLLREYEKSEFAHKLGPCPETHVDLSLPVKQRCIPVSDEVRSNNKIYHSFLNLGGSPIQVIFTYVYFTWLDIGAMSCIALGLSGILLLMIQFKPKVSCYFVGFLYFLTTTGLCYELGYTYHHLPSEVKDLVYQYPAEPPRLLYNYMEDFKINKMLIYGLIALSLVTMEAIGILLISSRKLIFQCCLLCLEAVKCWRKLPELIWFPFVAFLILVGITSFWCYAMLCITTAAEQKIVPLADRDDWKNDNLLKWRSFEKLEYVQMTGLQNLCWIYVFALLWVTEFISSCEQFCIEILVVDWYSRKQTRSPTSVIYTLLAHYVGSAAKGSFLALFTVPRLILMGFNRMLNVKKDGGSCFNAVKRRLESLEDLLSVPTHGVYAIVAMERTSFTAARRIVQSRMRKETDYMKAVSGAFHLIFFSAKMIAANLVAFGGVIWLKDREELYIFMTPVVLGTVFSFYIAHVLLSIIEMTVGTFLYCVCSNENESTCIIWANC